MNTPRVWTPCDGTIHIPSPLFKLSFPIKPFNRLNDVFAAVTLKLRKHSLVSLYTQYLGCFFMG